MNNDQNMTHRESARDKPYSKSAGFAALGQKAGFLLP
jgi:hypothetical protein